MVRDWTKEYFDIEERPEVGEKNLNLILQKPDNVANNVAKSDLQAENNRLKKVLQDIFIIAKRNKSALLATPENSTLSLIENECALALIGESEEK